MTFLSMTGQAPVPPASAPAKPGPLRMTPGRWTALAIAVPAALALIGWTGFSFVSSFAHGSYPFSYTFPVHNGQVALNIDAGNITLRQAPGSDAARLTGTVNYGLSRPVINQYTTPTSANVSMDCSADIGGDCGISANLDVPAQTGVTLWSNGGDVTASGFSDGMSLSTAGGNVQASNLAGQLQLDTGGGDLTGNGLNGTLSVTTQGGNVNGGDWTGSGTANLNTGGGDFFVDGFTGNFSLTTQGGNVDVTTLTATTSVVQSGGGDVTLTFTSVPKNLKIIAQGGNVNVTLPAGGTKYNITTPDSSGGNIDIPSSLVDPKSTAHTIIIDSGGGDISVR
jgi:Putative adhesin